MTNRIKEVFTSYINEYNLTTENLNTHITSVSHPTFFNNLTESILGKPTMECAADNSGISSLIYMPDSVKEKFTQATSIITINSFYIGIIQKMEYNYKQFPQLCEQLLLVRKETKSQLFNDMLNTELDTLQYMIKVYINIIYGMIDNPDSILRAKNHKPREFIVEESKKLILELVAFLLNNGNSIYYIDVDEIHTSPLNQNDINLLKDMFVNKCNKYINTTIATMDIENKASYYIMKKRYLTMDGHTFNKGIKTIDNLKTSKENKNFFGKTYTELFPEYAI